VSGTAVPAAAGQPAVLMFKSHLVKEFLLVQLPLLIDRHEGLCQFLVKQVAVPMAFMKLGCLVPAAAAALLLMNPQLHASFSHAAKSEHKFIRQKNEP
jgi:hypothetical protein